jgi:hypothetical protein
MADDITNNPAAALATIWWMGERTFTARNVSRWGTVLASDQVIVTVDGDAPNEECSVVGTIACGEIVRGNTAADSQASMAIHGYPSIPGNYQGPELGYTWSSPVAGEVEIAFVDPTPSIYDLDILILQQQVGVCVAVDFIDRAFNSLVFEAEAGASYTFVVDGYAGDAGEFEIELDCAR